MKALLLAAGYGTRLRPLTDHTPKPLTLFMGRPILDIVYEQVRSSGLTEIAVNTHHLPEVIRLHIQRSPLYKQPIHISHEAEILGTGGSINPLRPWLGSESLLIFNGDIVSSLDLKPFLKRHEESKAIASMVLIPHKSGTTPVYVRDGFIVSIGEGPKAEGAERRTFAGIHILSGAFIEALPREGSFSVIDGYQKFLASGAPVRAYDHLGFWADLGIPLDFLEAHRTLWADPDRRAISKALCLDESQWQYDEQQKSLFVDMKPALGFRNSFVFGPLGEGCDDQSIQIESCIVYPGVSMIKHRHEQGKIISTYTSLNIR